MRTLKGLRPSALSLLIATLIVGGVGVGGYAIASLEQFDGIQGRSYHARHYEKGRCEACHVEKEPTGYPPDDACLKCHEMDEIVAATARTAEDEVWQNPHNNLHYGTEVPCSECHGEHSNKAPMCTNCHNFEYPNHIY